MMETPGQDQPRVRPAHTGTTRRPLATGRQMERGAGSHHDQSRGAAFTRRPSPQHRAARPTAPRIRQSQAPDLDASPHLREEHVGRQGPLGAVALLQAGQRQQEGRHRCRCDRPESPPTEDPGHLLAHNSPAVERATVAAPLQMRTQLS
jgi:hypothetical protein